MDVLKIGAEILKERGRLYSMLATYDLTPGAVFEPVSTERVTVRASIESTELRVLSTGDVLRLNEQLTGGAGLRDGALLDSAVNNPFQTFGGAELYGSIYEKAAQLCFGLLKNHPFVDGNKRTAAHAMLVFLELNGLRVIACDEQMFNRIMFMTDGRLTVKAFAAWLA